MKLTQVGTDDTANPAETKSVGRPDHPIESTPRERWLFRALFAVVAIVIVAAVAQTIGRDVALAVRRMPVFRRMSATAVSALPAPGIAPSSFATSASSNPTSRSNQPLPGADAQIVPPRRRAAAKPGAPNDDGQVAADAENVFAALAPLDASDLHDAADALIVANRDNLGQMPTDSNPSQRSGEDANDLTNTLLETTARMVSLSWQDFAYPVEWRASDTSKSRMVYNNHRNRLLKAIAHTRPSALSLAQARKDYAAATAQFARDPRLEYAFGLVLWKHEHFAEAIDVFQSAARLDETPFLPAALAVAWGRFLIHEDRRGLDQLAHIARLLGTSHGDYPTAEQNEQAAILIGRAFGYLASSRSTATPELAEAIELTSRNIDEWLPPALRPAFENGRSQFGARQSELMRLAVVPQDQMAADHQRKQNVLQSSIDSLRNEMRDSRNVLSREHRSHVQTIREILTDVLDVRAQAEKLQPMMERLKNSVAHHATPKPRVDVQPIPGHYELVQMSQYDFQLVRRNETMTMLVQETATDRAARISQLNKTRDELKKIYEELISLREEQRALVAERHVAEAQHKAESVEVQKLRVIQLQQQRDLEQKLTALNKALRRAMTLQDGIDSIAAFVPWNVEIEGEALWWALTAPSATRSK